MGADWVALSFVQRPEDIKEVRDLVAGRASVMAKLEKPSVIDRLTEIVELSDGIMVARGDLGVEMPPETYLLSSVAFFALAARRASPSSSPRRCWS